MTTLKIPSCFIFFLAPVFCFETFLRSSSFFFSRWLKAVLCLPCFAVPMQSKTARGFWRNYLNLPPLVALDHGPGLSLLHLQHLKVEFSHATFTCCQTLSDASTVKLAELRTAFHLFLQVRCSFGADSEDSIIILTASK